MISISEALNAVSFKMSAKLSGKLTDWEPWDHLASRKFTLMSRSLLPQVSWRWATSISTAFWTVCMLNTSTQTKTLSTLICFAWPRHIYFQVQLMIVSHCFLQTGRYWKGSIQMTTGSILDSSSWDLVHPNWHWKPFKNQKWFWWDKTSFSARWIKCFNYNISFPFFCIIYYNSCTKLL